MEFIAFYYSLKALIPFVHNWCIPSLIFEFIIEKNYSETLDFETRAGLYIYIMNLSMYSKIHLSYIMRSCKLITVIMKYSM